MADRNVPPPPPETQPKAWAEITRRWGANGSEELAALQASLRKSRS